MAFSSREFYDGDLVAHASVPAHRLCDLPGVIAKPLTETPVAVHRHGRRRLRRGTGAGRREPAQPAGGGPGRPEGAGAARRRRAGGGDRRHRSVRGPGAAAARAAADVPGLEIDSVDGFQGREKEAVVMSLVRSNPEGEIGFLADMRRTNVALTRARRKLLVIGDSATLACHPFYQRMFAYFESIGAYHSVWEGGCD